MYNLTICGVWRIEKGILLGRDMVGKEDNNKNEAKHYGASALRLLAVGLLLCLIAIMTEEQQEGCATRSRDKRGGNLQHYEKGLQALPCYLK